MGENILMNHTCVIISAGDFTPMDIDIKEGDMCIAVDGGFLYCKMLGMNPDLVIGDMDSMDESVRGDIEQLQAEAPEKIIKLNPEKDDTDTLAAIRIALEKGYRQFRIYGALGGRVEHTIANIQCLNYLKKQGAKAYIMDANIMMTVIKDETVRFNKAMEGYMSLFALGEKAEGVTISGMKYLLKDAVVTNDYPIGISNEFVGEEGQVTVNNGMLLIIVTWA